MRGGTGNLGNHNSKCNHRDIHNLDNQGNYDNQKRDGNVSNHDNRGMKETIATILTR